ncbi:site-specific integrase [Schlegelella sp. S2-27]|uniref:Site-specific integrase n=1 Tax=Caldimonas mangrovi TaxID=2944811 RepID=A0ABT0YW16_9BURK|nr:site-specific integrase [Caldimonas mangrovi]
MASILKVGDKWRALIRRKGHKAQCKTFPTKAQAEVWARQREADLDRGEAAPADTGITIGQLIDTYRDLRDKSRPISDSSNEHYQLVKLKKELGDKRAMTIKPQDLVDFASKRKNVDKAGPYTVNMDVSKLGTALRYAASALHITIPDVVGSARPLLAHLGLIGGGGKRERRPTEDELRRVIAHLDAEYGRIYADAVAFAAVAAMRRGEVCSILWKDLDREKRLIGAWRKHPRKAKTWEQVPLLGEAWDIVCRQPDEDERIFPIHPQTLTKYFTQTCSALGIPDLHLHDLRHEGTSRLFEAGYEIQQVALVTGHRDWRNLKRYTNLRPEDLTKQPAPQPRQGAGQSRGSRTSASRAVGKSSRGKAQR